MRFGIFDQSEQPGGLGLSELLESRLSLAVRAEELGFWGYHKSEHHLIPLDHAPSPSMFLAALAQRTSTIRLCSLVHMLPFYHPIRLAEEICMLDHLSGGRVEIGFGKGISAPEHELWGIAADQAVARTEETLDVLLKVLQADGSFSHSGEFYEFDDVPVELQPLQTPYPPLWRPGTLETAARMGVSTVTGGPLPMVTDAIARYQAAREPGIGGGHEPTVGVIRKFIVAPTDDQAQEIGRRAWKRYTHDLGLLFRRFDLDIPNDPTIGGNYDVANEFDVIVAGSPQTVRAHVDELAASGVVEYVIGAFSFGDLTHDEVLRSLDLFGEHVIAKV